MRRNLQDLMAALAGKLAPLSRDPASLQNANHISRAILTAHGGYQHRQPRESLLTYNARAA